MLFSSRILISTRSTRRTFPLQGAEPFLCILFFQLTPTPSPGKQVPHCAHCIRTGPQEGYSLSMTSGHEGGGGGEARISPLVCPAQENKRTTTPAVCQKSWTPREAPTYAKGRTVCTKFIFKLIPI